MPLWESSAVARWCGGRWAGPPPPPRLAGVSTDSRTLAAGALYVALRGERFDGHAFVSQAFARGAAAALVAEAYAAAQPDVGPLLVVPQTLPALQALAAGYRRELPARRLGVTGSVGKTTVKEMVADVLGCLGPTARTPGNWNNEIGLPLSVLALEPDQLWGVFELGMNHPGELAPLCELLAPEWGVVTTVGPVHLEFFACEAGIAHEKAALVRSLPAGGRVFLDAQERWFGALAAQAPCRVVRTALGPEADYWAREWDAARGTMLVRAAAEGAAEHRLELPLPGEHILRDALLATAVGREAGVPWDALAAALRRFAPVGMRWQQQRRHEVLVINDAYNANPLSMTAALRAFAAVGVPGRKWLLLGGMKELGADLEAAAHRGVGRAAAQGAWAGLITVGALGALIAEGFEAAVGADGPRVVRCADHAAAARALREQLRPGDALLLKASRGERLEDILSRWDDLMEESFRRSPA